MDIFKPIEMYSYESKESSSIKIINHDGSEFLLTEGKNIKKISLNTVTGNVLLILKILENESELKFLEWKRDPKNLIKTIEVTIVKGGQANFYKLKVGIQMVHENYSMMETLIVLKHDTRDPTVFQAYKPLDYGIYADIKINKSDIKFKNVSKGTLINLGLSGIALALSIPTGGGSLTLPVAITLATSGSAYVSAVLEFNFELRGDFQEYRGKTNLLQQLVGELGKSIDLQLHSSEMKREETYEKIYDYGIRFLGLISGIQGIKTLTDPKNYKEISKVYDSKTYILLKKIRIKSVKNFQGFEGATRSLNKNKLTSDVLNGVGTFQEAEKWK